VSIDLPEDRGGSLRASCWSGISRTVSGMQGTRCPLADRGREDAYTRSPQDTRRQDAAKQPMPKEWNAVIDGYRGLARAHRGDLLFECRPIFQ
jgi:hypothetical protein